MLTLLIITFIVFVMAMVVALCAAILSTMLVSVAHVAESVFKLFR